MNRRNAEERVEWKWEFLGEMAVLGLTIVVTRLMGWSRNPRSLVFLLVAVPVLAAASATGHRAIRRWSAGRRARRAAAARR
ncbi:MAG: hypothetical protein V4558_04240 [Gemmatimonadota bacterium]